MRRIGRTRTVISIIPNMEDSYWFRDSRLTESFIMENLIDDGIIYECIDETLYRPLSPIVWSGILTCFEI